MTSFLLFVHVGPVQDFIASARRCRDLWYGSHLLSEASRAVARSLDSGDATTLIFPGRVDADAGGTVSVANKIQCLVRNTDADAVRQLAERARTALEDWMDALSGEAFDRVERKLGGGASRLFLRKEAEQHVEDLFEFYWVAVPLPDRAAYAAARKLGDRLLAARKNTRDWGAAPKAPFGIPKSSLDGVRESVIHEDCYGHRPAIPPAQRRRIFGVRSEERLCGIGLLKRIGPQRDTGDGDAEGPPVFHSSSHMASASARAAIARVPDAQAAWERFAGAVEQHFGGFPDMRIRARTNGAEKLSWVHSSPGHDDVEAIEVPFVLPMRAGDRGDVGLDGALLYRERLAALWDDLGPAHPNDMPRELERLRGQVLQEAGVGDPLPYYVMLQADGDRMGAAIDTLAEHAGDSADDLHQHLSTVLDREFASRCSDIVRAHGGSLLYAGGDDVLALLPAGTALQCARALRERFTEAMSAEVGGSPLFPDPATRPTLSVGLAIVHHLEPLSRVRGYAKEAERAAKDGGRNSLAVLLKKRGGGPRLVVGSWTRTSEPFEPLHERIVTWAQMLRSGAVPTRLAGRLQEVMAPLRIEVPTSGDRRAEDIAPTVRSLVRLTAARRNERGGGKPQTSHLKTVEALYDATLDQLEHEGIPADARPLVAVDRMVDELRIAELLRDAWNESFGAPKTSSDQEDTNMEASA